jgi:hypothetical protein
MAASSGSGAYVNEGLVRWEALRGQWLKKAPGAEQKKRQAAIDIEIDDVIDAIFTPEAAGRLPRPLPLPQMIDVLTDLWEADGLFD